LKEILPFLRLYFAEANHRIDEKEKGKQKPGNSKNKFEFDKGFKEDHVSRKSLLDPIGQPEIFADIKNQGEDLKCRQDNQHIFGKSEFVWRLIFKFQNP